MLLAGAGSALILLGAFWYQFVVGLAPCHLCIWQRWPHAAAMLLAALGMTLLWRRARVVAVLGTLIMLGSAMLAGYHFGVEHHWWQGPTTCTVTDDISGLSADQLLAQVMQSQVVRCDEITWEFLWLTMAGWNALISLALAALWLSCAVLPPNPYDSSSASQ